MTTVRIDQETRMRLNKLKSEMNCNSINELLCKFLDATDRYKEGIE